MAHFNLEDLTKPRPLLLMLHARGRNPPAVFAHADEATTQFAATSQTVVPKFLNQYTKLSTIRLEAPYQVPGQIDLARLTALLDGRISAAHDHFHSLREDPAYFENFVYEWSEHRQEQLLDPKGNKHPAFVRPTQNKVFWDRVLGSVVANTHNGVVLWQIARQMLSVLATEVSRNSQVMEAWKLGVQTPESVAQAFRNLRRFLLHLRQIYNQVLKIGIPSAPGLRKYWQRQAQDPNTTIIKVALKGNSGNELISLFMMLQNDQTTHMAGYANITDELQRLIDTDSTYHDQISPWLGTIIGDLALVGELTRQLDLFQPWAALIEADASDEAVKVTDQLVTQYLQPFATFMTNGQFVKLGEQDFLSGHKFSYPANKKRTKAMWIS